MPVDVFGSESFSPAQAGYKFYDLATTGPITLTWPFSFLESAYVVAGHMQVTGNGQIVTLPSATEASPGTSFIISNTGANTIVVNTANAGQTYTIAAMTSYEFCLTDNTTDDGVWLKVQYGATPGTADAAALAGLGLDAYLVPGGQKLQTDTQAKQVTTNTYTLLPADRASLIVVSVGTTNTITLPSGIDDGFYCSIRNQNTFPFSVVAQSGTINGVASITMEPSDSLEFVNTANNTWYSVGSFGGASSNFTVRRISLTGAASTITLAAGDYQVSMIYFTGVIPLGGVTVYFPATDRSWVVMNNTTSGPTLTLQVTNGLGPSYVLGRGEILDFISDSSVPVLRKDPNYLLGLPTAQGGTGSALSTVTTGDLLVGDSTVPTNLHFNRLVKGNNSDILSVVSGAVAWTPQSLLQTILAFNNTQTAAAPSAAVTFTSFVKKIATSRILIQGCVTWGAPAGNQVLVVLRRLSPGAATDLIIVAALDSMNNSDLVSTSFTYYDTGLAAGSTCQYAIRVIGVNSRINVASDNLHGGQTTCVMSEVAP